MPATPNRPRGDGARAAIVDTLFEPHLLLLVTLVAAMLIGRAAHVIGGDAWFNLVLGREIVNDGLIHDNRITSAGWLSPVVDLQWLAHLLILGFHSYGGAAGMIAAADAVVLLVIVGAALVARRRGATPGRVLLVALVSLAAMTPQLVLRAQLLALPLLVSCVALLVRDLEHRRWQTWGVIPLGVAWANLHGSVLLLPVCVAAMLPARILTAWSRGESVRGVLHLRDVMLLLAVLPVVVASPYGQALFRYYGDTLGNDRFRQFITEWQAPSLTTAPLTLLLVGVVVTLAAGAVYRQWRAGTVDGPSAYAAGLLLLLAAATLQSNRYALVLGACALLLLPSLADVALGEQLRFDDDRLLQTTARWTALIAVLLLAARALLPTWDARVSPIDPAFAAIADSVTGAARILVDEAHADRLLWLRPSMRGHVAHDSRVETMPPAYLQALADSYAEPDAARSRAWLAEFAAVVTDRAEQPRLAQAVERRWGPPLAERGGVSLFVNPAYRQLGDRERK